jgi:predicted nucleic-acid-binding protein
VLAVDTDVVVRLVTNDQPAQAARAAAVFRAGPVFIPKSVLLESEWVLRQGYGLQTDGILRALRRLLGLPNVSVEDPAAAITALTLLEKGFDFADALHVASSVGTDGFLTFDAQLVKRARNASRVPVGLA